MCQELIGPEDTMGEQIIMITALRRSQPIGVQGIDWTII